MRYINILTIHKEPNYGACLQAYALYKKIEELGGHPRMIDLSMDYRVHPYNYTYRLLTPIYNYLRGYDYCYKKASEFSEKFCPNRIGPFYTYNQLAAYPWDSKDCFMVGSDQVWNPDITLNLSNAYNFSFLPGNITTRFSYASSIGYIKNEAEYMRRFNIDALRQFKKIGVRENFAVEFLAKHGMKATEVIDPTLLLDNYDELIGEVKEPTEEEPYILYLSLGENSKMNEFANRIAKERGLKIVKHYGYIQPNRRTNQKFISVQEWLRKINNASLVVTDSFHATVFSILFRTPFYVYLTSPQKASRIENLLNALDIKNRLYTDIKSLRQDEIDFNNAHKLLHEYRCGSLSFLKSLVENS